LRVGRSTRDSRLVAYLLATDSSAFKTRRPEATEAFDQALAELDAGHHVSAVALLRRALALAPGDPEIARKLGEVASRID
jgi:Flp pilus assembly protein TadD